MNIEKKLKEMSIEQKAALCVGMNFWMTREYPDLGIPSLFLSDGPHGLRKQDVNASDHLGINESHQSVCYPTACTTACSWDRDLMFRMGSMLGSIPGRRSLGNRRKRSDIRSLLSQWKTRRNLPRAS